MLELDAGTILDLAGLAGIEHQGDFPAGTGFERAQLPDENGARRAGGWIGTDKAGAGGERIADDDMMGGGPGGIDDAEAIDEFLARLALGGNAHADGDAGNGGIFGFARDRRVGIAGGQRLRRRSRGG
jgi:hypothetical protein